MTICFQCFVIWLTDKIALALFSDEIFRSQQSLRSILAEVINTSCIDRAQHNYANDLVLFSETLEGLKGRLKVWKGAWESKGLRLNVKKTKMMISSEKYWKGCSRRQVTLCCL